MSSPELGEIDLVHEPITADAAAADLKDDVHDDIDQDEQEVDPFPRKDSSEDADPEVDHSQIEAGEEEEENEEEEEEEETDIEKEDDGTFAENHISLPASPLPHEHALKEKQPFEGHVKCCDRAAGSRGSDARSLTGQSNVFISDSSLDSIGLVSLLAAPVVLSIGLSVTCCLAGAVLSWPTVSARCVNISRFS